MAASADGLIQLRAPTPHHREGLLRLADAVSDSRRGAVLPANLRLSRVAEGAGGLLPQPYEAIVQIRNRRRGRLGLFVGALGRTRHTTHKHTRGQTSVPYSCRRSPAPTHRRDSISCRDSIKAHRRMTLRKVPVENFSKYSARRSPNACRMCHVGVGRANTEHDSRVERSSFDSDGGCSAAPGSRQRHGSTHTHVNYRIRII